MKLQEYACKVFNKIAEDDSYAGFFVTGMPDGIMTCGALTNCQVVVVPHVIYQLMGAGWIFPKRSALLSMFKVHVSAIKERGVSQRIYTSWATTLKGTPSQICPDFDGQPIGINKAFSLFGLMAIAAGLSILMLL